MKDYEPSSLFKKKYLEYQTKHWYWSFHDVLNRNSKTRTLWLRPFRNWPKKDRWQKNGTPTHPHITHTAPQAYSPFSVPASCPCWPPQDSTVSLPSECIGLCCPSSYAHHLFKKKKLHRILHWSTFALGSVKIYNGQSYANCINWGQMQHVLHFSWVLPHHPSTDCYLHTRAYKTTFVFNSHTYAGKPQFAVIQELHCCYIKSSGYTREMCKTRNQNL